MVKTRIKNKIDTAANWVASNPILLNGELGIESDTGRFKFGDGSTEWIKTPYANRADTIEEYGITDAYTKTEVDALVANVSIGKTVEHLGTFQGMTLGALLEHLDAWLDKHVGETGCSCMFVATQGAMQLWQAGEFETGIGVQGQTGFGRFNFYILVNTPNNNDITFLLTINNTAFYFGTRTATSTKVTWSKVKLLFSGPVAASATKLNTARTITLAGDVTGNVEFDGSENVNIETTLSGIAPEAAVAYDLDADIIYNPMSFYEEVSLADLTKQPALVDNGTWDGQQAYAFSLADVLDWYDMSPTAIQVIFPYWWHGKSAWVITREGLGSDGFEPSDFIVIDSMISGAWQTPILTFPASDPYILFSGAYPDTIITETDFDDIRLRFWYGEAGVISR